MSTTDPPLLSVTDLTKTFPIQGSKKVVTALGGISLTLNAGASLGVIGESGSGKTTIGRCVLRLLSPTSGSVRFDGTELTTLARGQLRRMRPQFSIVFQEPYEAFDPRLSVGDQVGLPLRVHGTPRDEERSRVAQALADVGLPMSAAPSLPRSLPAGVLQRAAIARAIITRPRLVVLDEPTSSLAPEAQAEVMELLRDLQAKHGMSYLYISHDLSQVRRFCDSVAVMYLGQVVEQGPTERVFNDPLHPYSRALLASVLRPVPGQLEESAERLVGEIPSPIDLPHGCYLASRCPHAVDRCREEAQDLREVTAGREARCWRVESGDQGPRLAV